METRCMGCMRIKKNHPICEHCGFDEQNRNASHHLPIGAVLGKQYIIGKVLDQNLMSISYLAWDFVMQQAVVIQEYYLYDYMQRDTEESYAISYANQMGSSMDGRNRVRFCSQADTLEKLWGCSSFPKILRLFSENKTEYIVTQYIAGTVLNKAIRSRKRPMSFAEAVGRLAPLSRDLFYAHNMRLGHWNIDPYEIILTDSCCCLLGFGASGIVLNEKGEDDRAMTTAALVPNPFDPPEHFKRNAALGPWFDIYSISAVLYYCVTGRVPPDALARLLGEGDLNIQDYSGLNSRQVSVIEKGMALNPNERYASMEELFRNLWDALE